MSTLANSQPLRGASLSLAVIDLLRSLRPQFVHLHPSTRPMKVSMGAIFKRHHLVRLLHA